MTLAFALSDWLAWPPRIGLYLVLAWLLYLAWLCIWIVLQKREPVATLSWVMSLALLPYIGFLIYFLFGPQKIQRQRLRRGRSRQGVEQYSGGQGDDPQRLELSRLGLASTGLPPSSATSVQWLIDGHATFEALLQAIAGARHHVHLEYYIWEPDRTGLRIRDALVECARRGVQVRLLLDAVGARRMRRRHLRPLLDAGAEVGWFHPTLFRPFTRPWLNLRTHRKIVVVDGDAGFVGGINITDTQDESLDPGAYRDLHLRVEGAVVRSLQLVFVEDWVYAAGCEARAFGAPEYWPRLESGAIHAQVLVSGPDSSWEAIHRQHVAAIHEARHRVWLVTPYFVPGEAARMALTSAALRGLDVRVIVPARSDSRIVSACARSYYDELLAAGVRVFEYQPSMLHSKALLVDEDTCVVGSANFDHRSFRLNFELSVLLHDAAFAARLEAEMEDTLSQAREVRADRPRPPLPTRLGEAFARLLSPLL